MEGAEPGGAEDPIPAPVEEEIVTEPTGAVAGGSALVPGATIAKEGGSGSRVEFSEVMPEPYPRRLTLYTEAEKLAELPRHGFDDFAIAAFWGMLAIIPGAYAGYLDLILKQPKDAKFDLLQLAIFISALTICAVGALRGSNAKTSKKYLRELFPGQHPAKGIRAWVIKKLSDS